MDIILLLAAIASAEPSPTPHPAALWQNASVATIIASLIGASTTIAALLLTEYFRRRAASAERILNSTFVGQLQGKYGFKAGTSLAEAHITSASGAGKLSTGWEGLTVHDA